MNTRGGCVLLLLIVLGCDGGGGGPSGPNIPNMAGQWSGTEDFIVNTCDEDLGPRPSDIVDIAQAGSAITIAFTVPEVQLTGTVQSSGAFQATGQFTVDNVSFSVTLQGQVTGNSITGTGNAQAAGGLCIITVSFDLTRL